jgi:hypothetical protein
VEHQKEDKTMLPRINLRLSGTAFVRAVLLTTITLLPATAFAQDGMKPGEAFATRFSGTRPGAGGTVINVDGTVGSIIDLRSPGTPPMGQHWMNEPQRNPVTAAQVGQVFGVVLDDATAPNIYLTATSAFGLHRTGNAWMPGMWGQGGGPGTVYRLDASTGYQPRPFAQVTLNGRPNSGASLGNIAYDRVNKQLFVSDLETGMIHRIRAADGADLGHYDHGTQGRTGFVDAQSGARTSLPPIAFDPNSRANTENCAGPFEKTTDCWNFAASGRRIWGLGVRRDAMRNETRLFYAVWSSPAFGQQAAWHQLSDDEKRNSVWSVRIGPDGNFVPGDVRREFILPDFFERQDDVARAGFSQPVSDISFSECGQRPVMLVAERGGIRNLGLDAQNPFATPHEARTLRYEVDANGQWRPVGRYDIGFYDRTKEGAPYIRANCSGGAAFGPGYSEGVWTADPNKPDQFVWMTGDSLCSPEGPCNVPTGPVNAANGVQQVSARGRGDSSEVHGLQGLAQDAFEEPAPEAAYGPKPPGVNNAGRGPNQSYLIDVDVNFDLNGLAIPEEFSRNDATKVGDIAIYQICEPPQVYTYITYTARAEHRDDVSHARTASHGRAGSHYRFGSHDPYLSHSRWGSHSWFWSHWSRSSHSRERSHYREASKVHNNERSHWREGSHNKERSHSANGSHSTERSHSANGSHSTQRSHSVNGSHNKERSHSMNGSHSTQRSHSVNGSSVPKRVHSSSASHNQTSSKNTGKSSGTGNRQNFIGNVGKSTPRIGGGGGGGGGRRHSSLMPVIVEGEPKGTPDAT